VRRLFTRLMREGSVKACYEAGVSGYDLYRRLTALGVACDVIAPTLTPRRPGQRVKADRRDAAKLVRLFRAGELTALHVPDETEEAGRDLVRCRDDIRTDVLRWRHRVLKLLARHGRVYMAGKNWSQAHWRWIRSQQFDQPPLQRAFEASLFALEQALARQAELDKEVEALPVAPGVVRTRQRPRRHALTGPLVVSPPDPGRRFPRAPVLCRRTTAPAGLPTATCRNWRLDEMSPRESVATAAPATPLRHRVCAFTHKAG
jgi:transposase